MADFFCELPGIGCIEIKTPTISYERRKKGGWIEHDINDCMMSDEDQAKLKRAMEKQKQEEEELFFLI